MAVRTLKKLLSNNSKRSHLVTSCTELISAEVNKKSGLSGMAIKGGYVVVKNLKSEMIPEAVDWLLDDFVAVLEPETQKFQKNGGTLDDAAALEKHFIQDGEHIADSLLSVTDQKATKAKNKILLGAYNKLRPLAVKEVKAALPGVARVIANNIGHKDHK